MPSYQDIETRLRTVEKKLDMLMKSVRITAPSRIVGGQPVTRTLYDLYNDLNTAGLTPVTAEEAANGDAR